MGKKYIIELLDDCNSEFKGIMAFGLTQEKQISVELIPEEGLRPYTEPDLDAVREEAFKNGYDAAYNDIDIKSKNNAAYQKGLSNAWETVKELFNFTFDEQATIFKTTSVRDIVRKYSASETIEKIDAYEQEQEKKDGVWIASEANKPSVDTTLICSKCGYTIKIKPHETPALNFCPKCGDCKNPKEEET